MAINPEHLSQLISDCVHGHTMAQKKFYYAYYPLLMRICMRYANNHEDAEQWVHDAFLKIFDTLHQYAGTGSFEGWLRKITVRVCIDQIRARNTRKNEMETHTVYGDQVAEARAPYVDNDSLHDISKEEVFRLLQRLPEKQRMVFNLVVFEAYSHKEIAVLLQITENHSYWLLHQARKQLKEIILSSNLIKPEYNHEQK